MGGIAAVVTAAAAIVALAAGYVQFVLRRTIYPCLEFSVEFLMLDRPACGESAGEVLCRIRNEGPGVGYVTNVRCYVRYKFAGESEVRDDDEPEFAHRMPDEGFYRLDKAKRFIQPGITQWYRKPLLFPVDTCLIAVWSAFEYELAVSRLTSVVAWLLRQPRAPNPTPYMVRRTFAIDGDHRAAAARRDQRELDSALPG